MPNPVHHPPTAVESAVISSGVGTTIGGTCIPYFAALTYHTQQEDMKLWPPAVPPQLVTRPATKMSVAVMRQPEN